MKVNRQPLHHRLVRHLREWHRKLGIVAVFFLLYLALTGVLLNHGHGWQLDNEHIDNDWLLTHYGISAPDDLRAFAGEGQMLVVADGYVWLGQKLLLDSAQAVLTAHFWHDNWLLLSSGQLVLFDRQGQLIERLDATSGLPDDVEHWCVTPSRLILSNAKGAFASDDSFVDWQPVAMPQPDACAAEPTVTLSATQRAESINRYRAQMLTLERLLLDFHSGRFFGDAGVWLMDAVALLSVLLSLSGLYIWIRYAKARR